MYKKNLKKIAKCSERGVLLHQTITPFCREIVVIFRELANNINLHLHSEKSVEANNIYL